MIYDSGKTRSLEWRKHNLNQLGLMLVSMTTFESPWSSTETTTLASSRPCLQQDNADAFIDALKQDFSRPDYETLFAGECSSLRRSREIAASR